MRTLVRLGLLALAAAGAAAASAPAAPGGAADGAAGAPRIVVGFANQPRGDPGPAGGTGRRYAGSGYRVSQSAERDARGVARDYGLRAVASWPIRALGMHCVVYEIPGSRPVSEVLAALGHDPRVLLAQPLHEFHTLTGPAAAPAYDDPLYDLQSNLGPLGIPEAHRRAQGAGVRIALVDTGVDAAHPDLSGRILRSRSFPGVHRSAFRSLRHGTAMAGIIAAVANNHVGIVGIAPLAQLEVFEACWQLAPDGDAAACNTFTLAQALAAALDSGAPLVNLSLGGPADPLLTALIEAGLRRGVIFVGAAGEEFPAAIPGVIGAAGSDQPAPPGAFAAPARHVLTLRPDAQYDFESGGSVSAAEITGVIALLLSASPTRLSAAAVATLLRPAPLTATAGPAAAGEAASINAAAALARLDRRPAAAVLDGL
jgi:subtilisin family serine protease